ncbi:MAG: PAS domain S-box protein, partial [Anaerolineae bacterium]|nr:PAS domain S-box protein [Anaerolineae bacterium]
MKDQNRTKEELIEELAELRQQIAEMGISETEYKRAEEALRRNAVRFRQLFDNMPVYGYLISSEGIILDVNNAVCRSLGYGKNELVGKPLKTIYAPESLPKMRQLFTQWQETGQLVDEEMVILTRDGERRTVLLSADAARDQDGQILHSVSVQKDITERVKAEEEIRGLAKFPSENPNPVLRVAKDGTIIYTNAAGRPLLNVWGCQEGQSLPEDWRGLALDALSSGSSKQAEAQVEDRVISLTFAPIVSEGYVNVYGLDITRRKKTEEEFEDIFSISPDMVGVFTTEGKLLKVNPSWERVLGYTIKELLDLGWEKLVHPDDVEETNKEVERQLLGSPVVSYVNRYRCKDGSYRILEWQATFAKEGIVHATARDVTERQRAEKALRESEERYHNLFEGVPVGLYRTSPTGQILDTNPAARELLGYPDQESLMAVNVAGSYVNPEDRVRWEALMTHRGVVTDFEVQWRRHDGEIIWVKDSSRVVWDDEGRVLCYQGSFEDITDRKRTVDQLRLQGEIVANMSEGVNLVRASDWVLVYTNRRFEEMFGYGPGELIGQHVSVLNASTERRPMETVEDIGASLNKHGLWRGEVANVKKDGTPFWSHSTVSRYEHTEFGQAFVSIQSDTTERKHAEEALREREERYWNLFNNAEVGMFRTRLDGSEILEMNEKFLEIFGRTREEMRGRPSVIHWVDPRERDEMARRLDLEGRVANLECKMLNKQDEVRICLTSVRLYREQAILEGSIIDITERRKAENALRRSLDETARSRRLLLALSLAAQAVQRARTPADVYRTIGDEIVKLGYHAVVFTLTDDQQHLTISHLTIMPSVLRAAEKLTGLSLKTFRVPLVQAPVFQSIISGGEPSFDDPAADFIAGVLPERVRFLTEPLVSLLGVEQCITVPLPVSGKT